MGLDRSFIPYGGYYSTPFCRWQGALSRLNSLELAADCTGRFLADRGVAPTTLDGLVLGITVPQRGFFYGAPWVAGLIGAQHLGGQMVSQACATSARALANGALAVEAGLATCVLALCTDRTSNGPHMYYPDPGGPGGMGAHEDPVWDNFNRDPWAGQSMLQTAENVARAAGITRAQQDEITVLRYRQYEDALASERAFQRRYMLPVAIPKSKKEVQHVDEDEGVFATTADGLARLRPAQDGGTVTFGTQTHPADAAAGMLVCSREQARALSRDPAISVRLVAFGEARVDKAMMPTAPVPAARQALAAAGLDIKDCVAVKTHNPFALNDVYFCREMGLRPDAINRFGSPLVYGHPQAPMGLRVIAELIEELVLEGGGHGLFTGCAAGDTAMAVVVKVG